MTNAGETQPNLEKVLAIADPQMRERKAPSAQVSKSPEPWDAESRSA
jgi:hypothetical protein